MGDIEKENITIQRFVWSDGSHKCEAGKLLCTLTELTSSDKHVTKNFDDTVKEYLKEKDIVEEFGDELHLKESKEKDAELLGNQISDYVEKEIESLPITKEIHLAPTIFMTPVPLPCFKNKNK